MVTHVGFCFIAVMHLRNALCTCTLTPQTMEINITCNKETKTAQETVTKNQIKN